MRCRPSSRISRLISNQWIQQQKPSFPALFPPASDSLCDVNDLCARFDKNLGPAVRVWVYLHLIGEKAPHAPPCKRFSHCDNTKIRYLNPSLIVLLLPRHRRHESMPCCRPRPSVAACPVELRLPGQNRAGQNEANDGHQRRKCAVFILSLLCRLQPAFHLWSTLSSRSGRRLFGDRAIRIQVRFSAPVSYTHLTLPTKRIV